MAEALVRKRGTLKASITRIGNYIADPNNLDIEQLTIRDERIRELFREYQDCHQALILLREEKSDDDDMANYEELCLEALAIVKKKCASATPKLEPRQEISQVKFEARPEIKLPQMQLPDFDGRFENWKHFSNMFKSMITDNEAIPNVQKLHYLQMCMKGDSAGVIQAIELTEENFKVAWDSLEDRYENKRITIQSHVKAMYDMQPLSKESANSLRELITNILKNVRALKALGQPTDNWDAMLLHLVTSKLDKASHKDWERSVKKKELATFKELTDFLEQRCHVLEAMDSGSSNKSDKANDTAKSNATGKSRTLVAANGKGCALCRKQHFVQYCPDFLKLSPQERSVKVRKLGLCYNCLKFGHLVNTCRSGNCVTCSKKHHTLLHSEMTIEEKLMSKKADENVNLNSIDIENSQVMLSTALVNVLDVHGEPQPCRVILDAGSQSNFMTREMVKKLGLPLQSIDNPISGIGGGLTLNIKSAVNAVVLSRCTDFSLNTNFLILPQITNVLPSQKIDRSKLNIPSNVNLADPHFHEPLEIDALLGAEHFFALLCVGQIRLDRGRALLQKTRLGWLLSGRVDNCLQGQLRSSTSCFVMDALVKKVSQFWEMEDLPKGKILSAEEEACEAHFVETVCRSSHDGRYTVKLPFRESLSELGNSYSMAKKRLLSAEKRLSKDTKLREAYKDFLTEYEDLHHMSKVPGADASGYFMPHHAVCKKDSLTTKVRIVFDASAQSDTGKSLNDVLMIGPVIQDDILHILLRFREFPIVLTGDIEKMYRQVNVAEEDRKFQKILWRDSPDQTPDVYQLNTLTYGTAPASFLATRVLKKLADDERLSIGQQGYHSRYVR